MIKSIDPLNLDYFETVDNTDYYLVDKAMKVTLETGKSFEVESGFKTDGASVPFPLSIWIKPNNLKYERSAVIHDYLYWNRIDRRLADKIFNECMIYEGTPKRYRILFYSMVRCFGWYRYYFK